MKQNNRANDKTFYYHQGNNCSLSTKHLKDPIWTMQINDNFFNNSSIKEKFEKIQYSVALITTGARKSTSPERLYKELGLECLKDTGSAAN